MPRLRVLVLRTVAVVGAVALILVGLLVFVGPRSALARVAIDAFLLPHGMHLAGGDLRVGNTRIQADGLEIDDSHGRAISAAHVSVDIDWGVLIGRSDRRYGLRAVDIDRPALRVVVLPDGSNNFSSFAPAPSAAPAPSTGAPSAPPPPFNLDLRVRDGRIDVENPTAFDRPGRAFAITDIQVRAALHAGIGTGTLHATYAAQGATSHVSGVLSQNDAVGFAQVVIRAPDVALAPPLNAFVSTPLFVTEGGVADAVLKLYDVGYGSGGPGWRMSATAQLRDGRIRVTPLDVPLRDMHGALTLSEGFLGFGNLTGQAAGLPIDARGSIRIMPAVRLAFSARTKGDLRDLRRLFAFSRDQPIDGPFATNVRIDGPLADVHVAGKLTANGAQIRVAGAPLRAARALFYYQNNHVTMPALSAEYNEGRFLSDGDVSLPAQGEQPQFLAVVTGTMPSVNVPFVTNLNRGGVVQMLASVNGPLSAAQLGVFARTVAGQGAGARLALAGMTNASLAAALALAWPRGDLAVQAGYDRSDPASRAIILSVVATRAPLRLFRGAAELPGILQPVALPDLSATIDGVAFAGGDTGASPGPLESAADLHARGLTISGERIGDLGLLGRGRGNQFTLYALSIAGRDVSANLSGRARVHPITLAPAAVVRGQGTVNLGAFASAANAPISGRARGLFEAALSPSGWAATIVSDGGSAQVAGEPVRDVALDATAAGGRPMRFAMRASALHGTVGAFGTATSANVFANGIDVAALAPAVVPLEAGNGVVLAHVVNSRGGPDVSASVSLAEARFHSMPLGGSAELEYAGNVLRAIVDVDVAQTRIRVRGAAHNVALGGSLAAATLDATASVREGDLGSLLANFLPSSMPVTGTLNADAAVQGSITAPHVTGRFDSPASTLRGVTLLDTGSTFSYQAGAIALNDGTIQLGTSRLALSGSYGAERAHVIAASPRVDLSDVNDFFEGRDVLLGTGPMTLVLTLAPGTTQAHGEISLQDAAALGIPLGSVVTSFGPARGDGLHVDAAQRSVLGATTVSGDLLFHTHRHAIPELSDASYNAIASASGVDLGLVGRLAGLEDMRLRGTLDAHGSLRGTFSKPAVDVSFETHDAFVHRLALLQARGSIEADLAHMALRNALVQTAFGQATAAAQIKTNGSLQGAAQVTIDDLRGAAQFVSPGFDARGSAQAELRLGGDIRHPVLSTTIAAHPGEVYGVAYDQISAHATFQRNQLSIGDTSAQLAGDHGKITLAGTLPIELSPFGLGPAHSPIAMHAAADAVQLAAFDPLVKKFGTIAGTLDANATLSGTAGRPELQGSARLRHGEVTSPFQTVPVHAISADVDLSHDAIALSDFSGTVGNGSFTGGGRAFVVPAVGLRHTPGLAYYMNLQAKQVPLSVPDWISGTVNGDIGLTKSGETPLFAGNVTLRDGNIPLDAIIRLATTLGDTAPPATINAPGLPPLRSGHIIVYGGGVYPPGQHVLTQAALATPAPSLFDLPSVNLQLATAAQNVRVRGGPVDLTTEGTLDIAGSVRDPKLSGAFASRRGTISAFGVTFRVEHGVLSFDPDQGVLPSLDATASTLISGDRISLDVSGRVDRLNTVMSSSSGQTPEQILATIVGGSAVGAFAGGVTGQTVGTSATRLLGAELTQNILSPFSTALAQSLSVEEVFIEFNQLGQIVLEVRKFVTPTISLIYGQTTEQPITQYWGASYQIRYNGALDITTTTSPSGFVSYQARLRVTFQ